MAKHGGLWVPAAPGLILGHSLIVVEGGGGGGGAAFVQAANGGANSGSTTVATSAFASSATTGNAILVAVSFDSATETVSGVTDTQTNSYTSVATLWRSGTQAMELFYALNITGGASHVVTATMTGSVGFRRIVAFEASGIATSSALDVETDGTSTSASPTIGPVTTTTDGQFCFAAAMNLGTQTHEYTAAGSWTEPTNGTATPANFEMQCEYQVQSSAGNISGEWTKTGTGTSMLAIATFKAA